MKNNVLLFFLAGLLSPFLSSAQSSAPSVVNASGGSAVSGYFSFEWSVGELALVDQLSGGNSLVVTNGFLQPYTLYPADDQQYNHFATDEIKVFPNPASSYVEINFFTKQKGRILLTFYDAAGKKVFTKELQGNGVDMIERIPVSYFSNGVYALHIDLNAAAGYVSKKGLYKVVKIN
jgi:hypothetical protein